MPAVPGRGPDNILGPSLADNTTLGKGNDTYYGAGGADRAYGNEGEDVIHGDGGADTIYGGQDSDKLYGDDGRDLLFGGSGNDYLDGGAGRDVLAGGLGNDTLAGGAGADRYKFAPDPGARDLVQGFSKAEGDRLDFGGQDYTVKTASDGDVILKLSGGGSVRLDGITVEAFGNGAGFFVG